MRTNLLKTALTLTITVFHIYKFYGQSKVDTIVLKKGEVFDILLLTQNSDRQAELKSYFQTAFPVAKRMSYQPIPGFKVKNYTQGNIQPGSLIFGKWNSIKEREDFLTQIVKEVPDFHERRRKIWSFFGLRYFEIKEDLSLKINRDEYHVATAYWLESGYKSSEFYNRWKKEIKSMGGEVLIQLKDGKSPFGYQYNPDFFVIASWKSEANFKAFQENVSKLELDKIQHINEFILE